MPKAWVREREQDYYYRKAKDEKYRSRAAYKLLQAVRKYRFLRSGSVVVDLGAAPGGWLQATLRIVGNKGFVIGVDLKDIDPIEAANVQTILGDITDPMTQERVKNMLPSPADALIADVSPNISGVWEVDHARQMGLAQEALRFALVILKDHGNFFVKVFQGDMLQDFLQEVGRHFDRVEIVKPWASRAKSAEIFVLGMGLKRRK